MYAFGRTRRRRDRELKHQRDIIEEGGGCEQVNHGEARKYCVEFGARRKKLFPGFFFCHECDLAEDYFCSPKTLGRWPKNWSTSKYCCKANHEDQELPTDRGGGGWSGATVKYSKLLY